MIFCIFQLKKHVAVLPVWKLLTKALFQLTTIVTSGVMDFYSLFDDIYLLFSVT